MSRYSDNITTPAPSFIVTVNGAPMDIRATSDLAIRQGKVRKDDAPESTVEIHYGDASARTFYKDGRLQVEISAPDLSPASLLATVKAES